MRARDRLGLASVRSSHRGGEDAKCRENRGFTCIVRSNQDVEAAEMKSEIFKGLESTKVHTNKVVKFGHRNLGLLHKKRAVQHLCYYTNL